MPNTTYAIKPIGFVQSELTDHESAPRQGNEGAPDAWVHLDAAFSEGVENIKTGQEVILITWFHKAHRDVLKLHPRSEEHRPLTGVFSTRSPNRPNPLGLHRVAVMEIESNRIRVKPLEAIHGTPVVDIKPVLRQTNDA